MRWIHTLVAFLLAFGIPAVGKAGDEPAQFRAFWVDGFNPGIKTPEQVEKLVADLQSLNMNAVVVQVRKRGDALFRKGIEPFAEDRTIPDGFDPLGALVEKAHAAKIQVHAWVNVSTIWPGSSKPSSPQHVFNLHGPTAKGRDFWLTQDEEGRIRYETGHSVDVGHPDYQSHFARVVTDLVKQYRVDGIHFDFVRYPEVTGKEGLAKACGYNPTNIARFNTAQMRSGQPASNDPAFNAWRRQQVTQLVRRARVELMETRPDVAVSGALIPWGDGPADEAGWTKTAPYTRVFQDWHSWRREGLLDLTIPMNYDRESRPDHKAFYDHWIAFEKRYRFDTLSMVGVGAYMNSVPDTLAQLQRALTSSENIPAADGICLYNYNHFNKPKPDGPTLADLRKALVEAPDAPFAKKAVVPALVRSKMPTLGVVAGIAVGADGQPLDSKAVTIQLEGGESRSVLTDGNGFFAALRLKPGKYSVTVPSTGRSASGQLEGGKVLRVRFE